MQISRLIEIIYILLDKKSVTAAYLAEKFEISVRTVYRDIEALSRAGFPVYAERGRNGGIKIMDGYCLDKSLLTENDKSELIGAVAGFSALGAADGQTAQRLKNILGCRDEPDWIRIDFSDWGASQPDLYQTVKSCISEKRKLSFDYYNSRGEMSHRNTFPVQLIFKSKAWYLSAYCYEKKQMRFFKLRRMKRAAAGERCNSPELCVPENNTERYYRPTEIVLKISENMAYRIYDDFDEEEISRAEDGSFIITCSFPVDDWVYGMILSYAESCEVLSPADIRENVREKLSAMMKIYKK